PSALAAVAGCADRATRWLPCAASDPAAALTSASMPAATLRTPVLIASFSTPWDAGPTCRRRAQWHAALTHGDSASWRRYRPAPERRPAATIAKSRSFTPAAPVPLSLRSLTVLTPCPPLPSLAHRPHPLSPSPFGRGGTMDRG